MSNILPFKKCMVCASAFSNQLFALYIFFDLIKESLLFMNWFECLLRRGIQIHNDQEGGMQTLPGRHHTPVPCSVRTSFSRPVSVEERQEGKQASEKQGNETRNVHWNKVENVKDTVRLTHMPLCRVSSAWVSAFCSIVIRLRCKVSLKDPNKNLDIS